MMLRHHSSGSIHSSRRPRIHGPAAPCSTWTRNDVPGLFSRMIIVRCWCPSSLADPAIPAFPGTESGQINGGYRAVVKTGR